MWTGDDVFIGPFVEIQKGCIIGKRSWIQSHSFICENVILGDGCFIGHGVTLLMIFLSVVVPMPLQKAGYVSY